MKSALIESLRAAEGRYLIDQELRPLHQYVATYAVRYNVYIVLRAEAKNLVLQALRKLVQTKHRRVVQEYGPKCQRDMAYTLECVAKAVLLDDWDGFNEEYVLWMSDITRALHKEDSAVEAYRALQQAIKTAMAAEEAGIVNSYLDRLIEAMTP